MLWTSETVGFESSAMQREVLLPTDGWPFSVDAFEQAIATFPDEETTLSHVDDPRDTAVDDIIRGATADPAPHGSSSTVSQRRSQGGRLRRSPSFDDG